MTKNCGANIENIEDLRDFYKRIKFLSEVFELWTEHGNADTVMACMAELMLYSVRKFEGKSGFYDLE